eukprot:TRINITY_DN3314_c0_g2_i1.p1 TRINITY_DN3314_c0_g2~~TRINITY_DN3314_c0_g2_i1.p1  ORF type:complete len:316 (+),score=106.86 TRINITY_DN3314_c0_g2_i1:90-1037(+)
MSEREHDGEADADDPYAVIDQVIIKLLSVRGTKNFKPIPLEEDHVRTVIQVARDVLMEQPCLLDLGTPVQVVGDVHGQYYDLLRMFEIGGYPPNSNYLFLGDYVDRGKFSVETIVLVLALKCKFKENFFILRGNHECAAINRIYGFFDDCKRRYDIKLWKSFTDLFNCLPYCAVIDEKIFCVHAGLSPELKAPDQLRDIRRPIDAPDHGLLCDLLWGDPEDGIKGFGESDRGVSFTFGADMVDKFLKKNSYDLICRAHQVVEDGYQFFANRQLVTIFSAPNYCGEFDNAAAFMCVDEQLTCTFHIVKPKVSKAKG